MMVLVLACMVVQAHALWAPAIAGSNVTLPKVEENCNKSVEDVSEWFQELYDAECLIQLDSRLTPCMLDVAHEFFETFVGQFSISRLSFGLLSFMAVTVLTFASSAPMVSSDGSTCRIMVSSLTLMVFFSVQLAQALTGLLSIFLSLYAYAAAVQAFSPCMLKDKSDSWAIMRVTTAVSFPFQSFLVQRMLMTSLTLQSLSLASMTVSGKLRKLTATAARTILCIWMILATLSVIVLTVCLVPIFAIPFVGFLMPPIVIFVLAHVVLKRMNCLEQTDAAMKWMIDPDDRGKLRDQTKKKWTLRMIYWQQNPEVLAKMTVYSALLSTMVSPFLILGSWLAFSAYSGTGSLASISHAYAYYFHVTDFTFQMPDIFSFLDKANWDTFIEVLASLGDLMDMNPANLLMASNLVFGVQTSLNVLKSVIVGGNAFIKLSTSDYGFPTKPMGKLMDEIGEGLENDKSVDEIAKEIRHSYTKDVTKEAAKETPQLEAENEMPPAV